MARALLFLAVLALAPLAAAQQMNPDARPVSGTLSPGSDAASATFDVRAEVETPMAECVGFMDPSAPDAVVDWDGGDLRIWVRAGFDATLAVYGPDGEWSCNDDFEGTSPVVQYEDGAAGRYAIWLGSFAPEPFESTATLWVGAPPPPPVLDVSASPLTGVLAAEGGFEAAQGAIEVSISAGGSDDVEQIDFSNTPEPPGFCNGAIDADQPTAAIDYDAAGGTGTLVIGAQSMEDDLVIVVRTPSGQILCNDDFQGLNPGVAVSSPESGMYTAWVGTFSVQPETVQATLMVSETEPEMMFDDMIFDDGGDFGGQPFTEGTYTPLDLDTRPDTRIAASPDGGEVADVTVTPTSSNPVSGGACTGYIETAPTAAITLSGDGPFALSASSTDDLTLTVRTPSGGWFCSDDADGLNPAIQIDAPESGTYLAWVGTFASFETESMATISAQPGEIVMSSGDFGGSTRNDQSDGTYDGSEIRPGNAATMLSFDGTVQTAEVMAGGTILNPVEGSACQGFVSERPTAEFTVSAESIQISASGDEDLSLTVRLPDGSWACSDDTMGTDPSVMLMPDGEGTISVWVGTYYRRSDAAATLRIGPAAVAPMIAPPPPPPAPEIIRG